MPSSRSPWDAAGKRLGARERDVVDFVAVDAPELDAGTVVAQFDALRAVVGGVPRPTLGQRPAEAPQRRAPRAVDDVGDAIDLKPLVAVLMAGEHHVGAPRRERPAEPVGGPVRPRADGRLRQGGWAW